MLSLKHRKAQVAVGVGVAGLAVLLVAARPMPRFRPAMRPPPAVRPMPPRNTTITNTNNFNLTRSFPFGLGTLHNSLTGSITTTRSLMTSGSGNSRTLHATTTTSTTANLSPSFTSNLTPTQQAALSAVEGNALRQRIVGHDLHVLTEERRLQMGFGVPAYAQAGGSYGSTGYGGYGGYGGYVAPGGDGMMGMPQGGAPGVQVAGFEENREPQGVGSVLSAAGVPNEEGHVSWPIGLRALPDSRAKELRQRVDALLQEEGEQAAGGAVNARLYLDLSDALDGLRKALRRDRDERFSLPNNTYEASEDFLARLDRAAKQLTNGGLNAPQSRAIRSSEQPPAAMPSAEK
jgi:hypothetical protein